MKQKKPLKMFVPESADYEWHGLNNGDVPYTSISRAEIHELVKAHAEKLGYWRSKDYEWHYDADYIYFWPDGEITMVWPDGEITMDGKDFDSPDRTFQEISPFDFLRLTPGDVESGYQLKHKTTTPEEIKTILENVSGDDTPTTTDRNEKAWEILKVIIQTYPNANDQTSVDMAFKITDEFLKHAGNK